MYVRLYTGMYWYLCLTIIVSTFLKLKSDLLTKRTASYFSWMLVRLKRLNILFCEQFLSSIPIG